ncbi:hypothetical protein GCM10012289_02480 [Nonomuraea cavernae]|uniref:Uncharacterized protein n=1 Tax=Nonomuraea cavernae TaxID=2045107 RepID=A0A917YRD9_9ACTN|nr:hypothetical protein GCM10012289_02480 [Nonomuraea cavernae]
MDAGSLAAGLEPSSAWRITYSSPAETVILSPALYLFYPHTPRESLTQEMSGLKSGEDRQVEDLPAFDVRQIQRQAGPAYLEGQTFRDRPLGTDREKGRS